MRVDLRPIVAVFLFCFSMVGLLKLAYWKWQRGARSRAYRKMLSSPRWEARKVAYGLRHEKKCVSKGWHRGFLSIHHRYYVWGRHVADYPDSALEFRCSAHHPRGAPFISEQEARRIEHR